jgi:hypothetical protein
MHAKKDKTEAIKPAKPINQTKQAHPPSKPTNPNPKSNQPNQANHPMILSVFIKIIDKTD